jgi:signal recognition particle receptor subunit beta
MQTVKMVVTGPFAAGKTQFIRAVSEIDVVSTERRISDETSRTKRDTTVALDFGRISVDKDLVLYLFGTPGQRRFEFMWEILAEGMLGFIVLADSTRPETFKETKEIIEVFTGYSNSPYVVAATKQDLPDAWPAEDIRIVLGLDEKVPVIPCVGLDRASVKAVLLALLYAILQATESGAPHGSA